VEVNGGVNGIDLYSPLPINIEYRALYTLARHDIAWDIACFSNASRHARVTCNKSDSKLTATITIWSLLVEGAACTRAPATHRGHSRRSICMHAMACNVRGVKFNILAILFTLRLISCSIRRVPARPPPGRPGYVCQTIYISACKRKRQIYSKNIYDPYSVLFRFHTSSQCLIGYI